MTRREPTTGGLPPRLGARAAPAHGSRPPPAHDEYRLPSAPPCRGGCRDQTARQPLEALASTRCASARSTEPIETTSIAKPREPSTGNLIMVATRRNASN